MQKDPVYCPICGDLTVQVVAELNRKWWNALLTAFGSSCLEVKTPEGGWLTFMKPSRGTSGLYCTKCGALTLAPSIGRHREQLGLDKN